MTDRYTPGDRVFAKLKGYPPWPARVIERVASKAETYRIYFYGTYEEASIKVEQIYDYNEGNIIKYGKLKKNRFKEAMQEIEDNVGFNEQGQPLSESKPNTSEIQSTPSEGDAEEQDTDDTEGELLIDEGPPQPPVLKREISKPPALTPAPPMPKMTPAPPRMTPAPGVSGSSITKGTPTAAPPLKVAPVSVTSAQKLDSAETPKQSRRGSKSISKKDAAAAAASTSGGTSTPISVPVQEPIVSRSGRKIKPKRFADDELPKSAAEEKKGRSREKSGDESATPGDGPPAAKRARRRTSIAAAATPPPTSVPATNVPAGKGNSTKTPVEKPKLVATRGRTSARLSSSGSDAVVSLPVTASPATSSRSTRLPRGGQKSGQAVKTQQSAEAGDGEGGQEEEDELGLAEDKENNSNAMSPEEGQWSENGEPGSVEYAEGEDEGEGEEELESSEDEQGDVGPQRETVHAANGMDVELIYGEDRPDETHTEDYRIEWDLATARNALKARTELEKHEFSATNFMAQLARSVDTKDEELRSRNSVKSRESRILRMKQLRVEGEMIEIMGELVRYLNQMGCDPEKAMDLLDRLAAHELNSLALKKHPEVVIMLSKLRRYVGNVDEWDYTDAEKVALKRQIGLIRLKVNTIYQSIKSLFFLQPDQPLIPVFAEAVSKFEDAIGHLPLKKKFALIEDPSCTVNGNEHEGEENLNDEMKKTPETESGDKETESEGGNEEIGDDNVLTPGDVNVSTPGDDNVLTPEGEGEENVEDEGDGIAEDEGEEIAEAEDEENVEAEGEGEDEEEGEMEYEEEREEDGEIDEGDQDDDQDTLSPTPSPRSGNEMSVGDE